MNKALQAQLHQFRNHLAGRQEREFVIDAKTMQMILDYICELEAKQKPVGLEAPVFVDKQEQPVGRMAPVYSNDPRLDVIRRMPLTIAFEGGNIVTINNGKPKCR